MEMEVLYLSLWQREEKWEEEETLEKKSWAGVGACMQGRNVIISSEEEKERFPFHKITRLISETVTNLCMHAIATLYVRRNINSHSKNSV